MSRSWWLRAALVLLVLAACASRRTVAGDPYATVATPAGGERVLREPTRGDVDADDVDPGDVEPVAGAAGGPVSLEAVTVLALERNADLAVQRLAPAIAETFEQTERAEFGATLFADGQYSRELSRETNRATMMQFEVEGSTTNAEVGVRQRAPTGTTVETSIAFRRDESNRAPEQQELRLGVTITQSLLAGVDPDANLARVRQAALETRASRHELRAFVTALLLETEITYWQLALATRSLAIHEESLALSEQEAAAMTARIEVGDMAPADAPAVTAQVALRRQALVDARAAADALRLRLARLLRLDEDAAPLEVADAVAIEPVPIEDAASHRELALERRADVLEARVRLEQRRLETVATANGLLPRLDVFVQLTKTGFGSSFGDAVTGMGEPTYEVVAGLRFEQLLGNAAASAADRRAHLSHAQAERAIENLEGLIRLDVSLALNELERARAQITASRDAVASLEALVAVERDRLAAGEGTALLLAQAERDLVEARVNEVAASVDYRIGLTRLYAAEGTLLERRGVQLGAE